MATTLLSLQIMTFLHHTGQLFLVFRQAGSPVTIMMEDIHISTAYKFSTVKAADDGNNGI